MTWRCPRYRTIGDVFQSCLANKEHEGHHKYAMTRDEVRALARKLATAQLDAIVRNRSWIERAACGGRWNLFWWEENSVNRRNALSVGPVLKAKALCAGCPVRRECLTLGMEESDGIWGGTLPWERRRDMDVTEVLDEMTQQAASLGLIEKEGVA